MKDNTYKFKTILGDKGCTRGRNYWEIIADKKTKVQMKIGVSCSKDFDLNECFSDFDFGFAFWGLGQLRHNSQNEGKKYGRHFKNKGVLGVLLDMNKGTLSFALNEKFLGVAF